MRWFYCLCLSFDCVCNLQLRKAQRRSRSMSMTKSREIADALATDNPKRLKWPKCQPDPYQLTSCMQVLEVLDLKTCFCIDLGLYDGAAKKNMLFKIHVHYRTIAVVGAHRTHASSVQNWTVHPFAKSLQTKPSNVFQGLCRHVNSRSWLMTSSNSWSNRDRLVLSKKIPIWIRILPSIYIATVSIVSQADSRKGQSANAETMREPPTLLFYLNSLLGF